MKTYLMKSMNVSGTYVVCANRLYGQSKSVIDRGVVEACLTSIIQSEIDSYQLLTGMLTENQSTLLRAIARGYRRCHQ